MPSLVVPEPHLLTLLKIPEIRSASPDDVPDIIKGIVASHRIELDSVSMQPERGIAGDDESLTRHYKFDLPANRADLCCAEGLAMALNVYMGAASPEDYAVHECMEPALDLIVDESALSCPLRPICRGAVLRGVRLTQRVYNSFIDFQDKLHQNAGRRRRLVAIGTHDLSTLEPPFTYALEKPEDIRFIPLNKTAEMDGHGVLDIYRADPNLQDFVPILDGHPRFPVFRDSRGVVLSMPPLINGNHSKLVAGDKPVDIFIDITGTDEWRVDTVLRSLVACFSMYCDHPFTYEPVRLVFPPCAQRPPAIVPLMSPMVVNVPLNVVHQVTGLCLTREAIGKLVRRMGLTILPTEEEDKAKDQFRVSVPAVRNDIMHPVDVADDVMVAYGVNKIPEHTVESATTGSLLPVTRRAEAVRRCLALMEMTEVLNFGLCSNSDAAINLQRAPQDTVIATVTNSKSAEFSAVRSSLVSGLLRTAAHNNMETHPLRLFEVGQVLDMSDIKIEPDGTTKRLPECQYHAAVLISADPAPFSEVHGVLDGLMMGLQIEFTLEPDSVCPLFLDGWGARIVSSKGDTLGRIGVIHPDVLVEMGITWPVALFEIAL